MKLIEERRPDFVQVLRRRLANPAPLAIEANAVALGQAVLRQLEPDSAPGGYFALRASALGRCARQVAYRMNEEPENGHAINARSRTAFAMGDAIEVFATTALADALETGAEPGWSIEGVREGGQLEVALDVTVLDRTLAVAGHPDGVLMRNGEPYAVLEVKSCTSYAFDQWERGADLGNVWGPDEGYWWQTQVYMAALGLRAAYVIAVCKEHGAITGWWQQRDLSFNQLVVEHLQRVLSDDPPRLLPDLEPLRPSAASSKRGELPWHCAYCAWWRTCWPSATEKISRGWRGKPKRTLIVATGQAGRA